MSSDEELFESARREATRMRELAAAVPAESEIRMPVGSFAMIAETLAALVQKAVAAGEFGPGDTGAAPGGSNWVPLSYYERLRHELAEARDENARLRERAPATFGGLVTFGR